MTFKPSPASGWQRARRVLTSGPAILLLGLAIYVFLPALVNELMPYHVNGKRLSDITLESILLGTLVSTCWAYLFGYRHGEGLDWSRLARIVGIAYAAQTLLYEVMIYSWVLGLSGNESALLLIRAISAANYIVPTALALLKLIERGKVPTDNAEGFKFFRRRLLLLGTLLTVLPTIGALMGYVYGYNRTDRKDDAFPLLHDLSTFIKRCMVIGAILSTLSPVFGFLLLREIMEIGLFNEGEEQFYLVLGFLIANLITTLIAWSVFSKWRSGMIQYLLEMQRFGTAKFATDKDIAPFDVEAPEPAPDQDKTSKTKTGEGEEEKTPPTPGHLYVGTRAGRKYVYRRDGHMITVAGTRAGKGANLLIPNLLDKSSPPPTPGKTPEANYLQPEDAAFQGSWVVVDPKGEAFWYTAAHQEKMGRQVVVLNPWHLIVDASDTLNPLDLVKDNPERTGLADDLRVIAETIVPISQQQGSGGHFNDRARTLILTMLMHLIVAPTYRDRITFNTLWEWFSDLDALLMEMAGIEVEPDGRGNLVQTQTETFTGNAAIVSNYALQFWQLRQQSEREYGSVVSTAQRYMDIFSSRDLQAVMASSTSEGGKPFDLTRLAQDKICLYIILPPDKLKTHATWLRLVVASCLRAVLREPGHRVGFILDEFYALGYLRDIDVGMGAYAGYGITLWAVLQSLSQLRELYPRSWENFLANAAVTHAFGLNDVASLEYISKLAGQTSYPTFNQLGQLTGATARPLTTPDEVRRGSDNHMFTFLDRKRVAVFDFLHWYEDPEVKQRGNPKRLPGSQR